MPALRRPPILTALLAFALPCGTVLAQERSAADLLSALAQARAELAAQAARIAAQQQLIDEQRRRIDAIAAALAVRTEPPREPAALHGPEGSRVGTDSAGAAPVVDAQSVSAQPLLLTPPGTLVVEPSLQYSYVSTNRVSIVGFTVLPAITVGLIDVQRTARDTLTAAVGLRYGLTDNIELEARIPYVYRSDTAVTRPINSGASDDVSIAASGQGLGDLEGAVRYQLPWPAWQGGGVIGELRVKSRTGTGPLDLPGDQSTGFPTELATGTGFWSMQPALTAVLSSDPAVIYGGASYQWNVARNYNGLLGRYDPGDGVGANVGIGLALNDRASLSIGYDHLWLGRNRQNRADVPGSLPVQVGRLLLGYSHRMSARTRLQLSVAAGLTDAAPDVQLTLRMPTSF